MNTRSILIALLLILVLAVMPASAQEADSLVVSTGGIMLTVDKDFATGVSINTLPADPPEYGPGFAEPGSTQIAFSNPPPGFAPESILTIRFYRVEDMLAGGEAALYSGHRDRLTQLQQLLQDQNVEDLNAFMQADATLERNARLPFIPVYTHGSVIQARAAFLETPLMRGVRYITAFSADVSPFTSNSFIYTYQGVTNDNSLYVSVQAFLTTDLFPAQPEAFDPAAFFDNLPTYLDESIATLNAAQPTDFSPSLADVDAIVESITVTPLQ